MKEFFERFSGLFLYGVAAVLPVAGVLLAGGRFLERDNEEGARLLACAALGVFAYFTIFR